MVYHRARRSINVVGKRALSICDLVNTGKRQGGVLLLTRPARWDFIRPLQRDHMYVAIRPIRGSSPNPLRRPIFFLGAYVVCLPASTRPLQLCPLRSVHPSFHPTIFHGREVRRRHSIIIGKRPIIQGCKVQDVECQNVLRYCCLCTIYARLVRRTPGFLRNADLCYFAYHGYPLLRVVINHYFFVRPRNRKFRRRGIIYYLFDRFLKLVME